MLYQEKIQQIMLKGQSLSRFSTSKSLSNWRMYANLKESLWKECEDVHTTLVWQPDYRFQLSILQIYYRLQLPLNGFRIYPCLEVEPWLSRFPIESVIAN
jgi:hypothetical protein